MSLDKNKHYLFFEITGKTPFLTEIKRINDRMAKARETATALAQTFHEKAMPLISNRWGFEMVGIFVESDTQMTIKGWRHRKQWGKNHFVPALNTKIGTQATRDMDELKFSKNSEKLTKLTKDAFGEKALSGKFVDDDHLRQSYWLDWGWGAYPIDDEPIYVIRVLRTPEAEKAKTPRGLKKVKYSRIVEISELYKERKEQKEPKKAA